MCGIVGYTGVQGASPILLEGLKKLEYRGYDSAGIALVNDGKISIAKVTGRIANLCEKTNDGKDYPGTTGIGHTRWATHGAPSDTNAHPHLSNDGRFAIVHNGIIENYMSLHDELTAKGYHFESETDTEVIVHLLEMYYKGDIRKAVVKTSARLQGSYALGVICADDPDKLYVAREASPLILGVGVGENFFASDVTALVSYTRNAIYLDDGEFAEISPEEVKVFDCTLQPVNKKISRIVWDIQAAEKGGYEHFMLKEIMEQPRAFKATIAPRIKDGEIVLDETDLSKEYLQSVNKIVITACGSAYYAGCAAKYTIEKLCKVPVITELASELRYADPLIDEHTLLIVLSQSGETADTIAAMKECKNRGTTQLAVLYLFSLYAAKKTGTIDDEEFNRLLSSLKALPKKIQETIDTNLKIHRLAIKYYDNKSMFFIGRNTDYAIALEGALKMKEISYIHAESYAAGELKHGTIALIEEHRPVVALCYNEAIMEKTLSNIVEVKARGADVLALTYKGNNKIVSVANDVIYVPKVDTLFSAAVEIIPLQMLAYYVAKLNECDIDKPKNLAKSVTVE